MSTGLAPIGFTAEADDQFTSLAGASLVGTPALLATRDRLREVIKARAMACVHGDAGLGKTYAVNAALRAIAPRETLRIQFRSRPTPRDIRHELFRGLGLPGTAPRRPVEFDAVLKSALSRRFRVLVCDEAQQLSRECFEYWRYLWDDRDTRISIVFCGGGNCYEVLRREPMLRSRIYSWLAFRPMDIDEVLAAIRVFHPIWQKASDEDVEYVDNLAAHGNWRAWALVTRKVLDGLALKPEPKVSRELIEWTFSTMEGGS